MWLQNVYTTKNVSEQGLSLALAVTEHALQDATRPAAWRLHGGGFAGTIQAFVPFDILNDFVAGMDGALGQGACHVLSIRPQGGVEMEVE
jgi:galactokinase